MPWRKRAQVIGAIVVFIGVVVGELALIHHGWTGVGVTAVTVTLILAVLGLQAWWVRFDLPAPFGAWSATSSSSSGTGVRRVLGARAVALTFDDGPGPDTPTVLDALDQAGVRATFFVLGAAARARPEVVRDIARRGHVIGIHGDTHRKLHLALPGTIRREIDLAIESIRAAGVEPAPLFRAPHGFKGPLLALALRERGLRLVGWTRGVWDSDAPPKNVIIERATRDMTGGEILLLHDGAPGCSRGEPGVADRGGTAAAIREIAARFRKAGLEFVTLEPLYAATLAARAPRTSAADDRMPRHVAASSRMAAASGSRRIPRVSTLVRALVLVAVIVLIARALGQFDFRELVRSLAAAKLPFLVLAAAANVLALAMQAGRWLAVVHPIEPHARARDAFFALVAGYAIGLIVPARASDLARAHLMARRTGASTATLTTTAVVDHLLGTIALLAAIGIATAVWPLPAWLRSAGPFAAAAAIAVLVTLWFIRPRPRTTVGEESSDAPITVPPVTAVPTAVPGKPSVTAVPGKPSATGPAADAQEHPGAQTDPLERLGSLGRFLARLRAGLVAVGSPRALAVAALFAAAGWLGEGLIAHLSLKAFGLPAGVAPSMMAVVATTLSAAASVSPGNAGAFEVACVVALAGFGVPQETALAFAIGYHCVHLLPTAAIGGGWLIVNGFRPAALRGLT